eukprot:TRINITY_DN7742_c0_g1_i2.p1 TRINITY_DN7742_c0_g1~~TRINITY_DN7742_c0_g1_i2.p1  ORF type:complete len:348 (-),score=35.57 TRINITY_DN7742_c0_g1_i2:101-1144(-)
MFQSQDWVSLPREHTFSILTAVILTFFLSADTIETVEQEEHSSVYQAIREVKTLQKQKGRETPRSDRTNHSETLTKSEIWSRFVSYSLKSQKDTMDLIADFDPSSGSEEPVRHNSHIIVAPASTKKSLNSEFSSVTIDGWESLIRENKKQNVYIIHYYSFGFLRETKRSYSEFLTLYEMLQDIYKHVEFPPFPSKTFNLNPADTNKLQERKECFENLLKFIFSKNLFSHALRIFLSPLESVEHFTREVVSAKASRRKSFSDNDDMPEHNISMQAQRPRIMYDLPNDDVEANEPRFSYDVTTMDVFNSKKETMDKEPNIARYRVDVPNTYNAKKGYTSQTVRRLIYSL